MPLQNRVRLLVVLLAAGLVVLAGCGAQRDSAAAGASRSLADLQSKLGAIGHDSCETGPPAAVYAECARFLTELTNVLVAARAQVAGLAQQAPVDAAADDVRAAIGDLIQAGCAPSVGRPPSEVSASATTCAADYSRVQDGLRALAVAIGAPGPGS